MSHAWAPYDFNTETSPVRRGTFSLFRDFDFYTVCSLFNKIYEITSSKGPQIIAIAVKAYLRKLFQIITFRRYGYSALHDIS